MLLRLILVLFAVGIAIYSFIDCLRVRDEEIQGLPRPLWLLVVVALPVVGPLLWLMAGRTRPPGGGRGAGGYRPVLAPDDDPEFLRALEQERRRRDRERREADKRRGEAGPPPAGTPDEGPHDGPQDGPHDGRQSPRPADGRPDDADGEDHSGRAAS